MRKTIAAGLFGLMLGPTAPLVTGVAHAGCTGKVLQHTFRCDCNPGLHWDPGMNECMYDNPATIAVPQMPWPKSCVGGGVPGC
jgi:hypothetical protein